jgi:hypothetical protein
LSGAAWVFRFGVIGLHGSGRIGPRASNANAAGAPGTIEAGKKPKSGCEEK